MSAPGEVAMRFSRILVPTDFSTGAENAAVTAVALAAAVGGRVDLVHWYNLPALMTPDGSTFGPTAAQLVEAGERADAALAEALQALRARVGGRVRIEGATRIGTAADEILRIAEKGHYDLIVMGTHGRTGLRRLMLGSVAEQVLRRASIPVLTVRAHDADDARDASDAR
jgi:nucleotide-binding universal stress UspA family protein